MQTQAMNRDSSFSESELATKYNRNINKIRLLAPDKSAEMNDINASIDKMVFPPIMFGRHKKTNTDGLFPKIGGMGSSAYTNSSPFSSMSQNRKILDNTFREKIWTGEEVKNGHFEVEPSFKSLESTEVESKQLTNISNPRRIETINATPNSLSEALKTEIKKHSLALQMRKGSTGTKQTKPADSQTTTHKELKINKKLDFGNADRKHQK
uniref:Uncharacterized protein n=1 Tax=Euplotes harpa TaxID=151035 RepID=A0A7S3J0A9_9SPIT|mmetsp:Transcript_10429/g.11684  ORF Transcript_10429/g.11684 Transcript_10429/m.11684 type:complete len:210 (+) Transcript_10429:6-635(+)